MFVRPSPRGDLTQLQRRCGDLSLSVAASIRQQLLQQLLQQVLHQLLQEQRQPQQQQEMEHQMESPCKQQTFVNGDSLVLQQQLQRLLQQQLQQTVDVPLQETRSDLLLALLQRRKYAEARQWAKLAGAAEVSEVVWRSDWVCGPAAAVCLLRTSTPKFSPQSSC
ncbi:uncharacterized protein EMH_0090380 [Eimeria mitis]|uniref:Uncharacterized protein n=1 Tax=Eimeria mitis TaxID=44415 RepID=U6K944_9EIME|nr:uncharacterized protein EMH_0090380 [Eimeria mitis]CDJ34459.1 hypothetical protein EMH_0090380 [Eimeria mitis]